MKEWVPKTGKKRKAYPTREEALVSYLHRKRRQISLFGLLKESDRSFRRRLGHKILTKSSKSVL